MQKNKKNIDEMNQAMSYAFTDMNEEKGLNPKFAEMVENFFKGEGLYPDNSNDNAYELDLG